MEFQALKVLVIALAMRSADHLLYTPAPDILHESAGHAPFIVDVDYAEFLQRFGEIGMKAISNEHDFQLYEAIRALSILKENPATSTAEIAAAEQRVEMLAAADVEPSEAALLTRLHWWTVEYGLVGDLDDYRIFGAGLLSSLGESRSCLDDTAVRKVPLTVNAVEVPYDITAAQPQLFVTRSCKHLSQVLNEFAASMAFMRGGAAGLQRALESAAVCTAEYDSGVQVSGIIEEVLCDAVGNVIYLRTRGPTQLAWKGTELYGHGTGYHTGGFGSPVGLLKDFSRCLSEYTFDELKAHDIRIDERVRLEFLSGIVVEGILRDILRQEHRNLLLSFEDCTVTDLQGRVLFDPSWGTFDMAVGGAVSSVFGGAADRGRFRLYKPTPSTHSAAEAPAPKLMAAYQLIADLRGSGDADGSGRVAAALDAFPDEWLLRAELLHHADKVPALAACVPRAVSELQAMVGDPELRRALTLALPVHFRGHGAETLSD
jgi:phenylalanine-4-hydroxylase